MNTIGIRIKKEDWGFVAWLIGPGLEWHIGAAPTEADARLLVVRFTAAVYGLGHKVATDYRELPRL
ncbi:hypothetical protein [Paenibacillus sinopodophylli]|uniref:hypothetical protein n=1 Tax=Paenibacillus sinopodophylli TaxID=1837342 RepID=UPI00110CB33D|nr:hypothetical protein [Paenibacillus sinopodophylli]